ncbi:MAG: hypothetical protein ABI905_07250 [Betaproteobacteria bacterium]
MLDKVDKVTEAKTRRLRTVKRALLLLALLAIGAALFTVATYFNLKSIKPASALPTPAQLLATGNQKAMTLASASPPPVARKMGGLPPTTPLPSVSEPAALHQDFLLAEIAKGNPRAACRYAIELKRCGTSLPTMRKLAAGDFSIFTNAGIDVTVSEERRKEGILRMQKRVESEENFCAAFTPKSKLSPWTQLYIAASGGHTPSAYFFATFTPSLPMEFMTHYDEWELRKQYGELFLRSAADSGYAPAVVHAASSYSGELASQGELVTVTPVNQFEAAKYAFATRAWKAREQSASMLKIIERAEKVIGAEEVARAREAARKLVESWGFDPAEFERTNDNLNFNGRNGGFCSD